MRSLKEVSALSLRATTGSPRHFMSIYKNVSFPEEGDKGRGSDTESV